MYPRQRTAAEREAMRAKVAAEGEANARRRAEREQLSEMQRLAYMNSPAYQAKLRDQGLPSTFDLSSTWREGDLEKKLQAAEDEALKWKALYEQANRKAEGLAQQVLGQDAYLNAGLLGLSEPPKTLREAKAAYRREAKFKHPDAGGSQEQMVLLQGAFEYFAERLK